MALILSAAAQVCLIFQPFSAWAQSASSSVAASAPAPARGARSVKKPDVARQGIPTEPSAPPSLTPRKAPGTIHCQRRFLYRGKMLDCDSNLEQDAERLRPIMQDVPAALAELDSYQHSKAKVRELAYGGGLGLGMALGGFIASRLTQDSSVARDYRLMGIGGGLIVIGATLISGLTTLAASSEHLGKAVKEYNQARPGDPIELQFTTGIEF